MSLRRATSKSATQVSMERDPLENSGHIWLKAARLLCFHEISRWQQDNQYLLSGYRLTSGSTRVSFAGLFYLHNQTVNIYSHLVGSAVFCALAFYFYRYFYQFQLNTHIDDIAVISIYCLGVAVCFAFSATFHIMWNHSHSLSSFCNKLDYLGILILMWGAGIPTIYYGSSATKIYRGFYWMTASSTALCCAIVTLHPRFISPQFRRWHACFYAGFGLSSVIFVVHGLIIHGWALQRAHISLHWMAWMATSNLVGAAIYAARIPERWVPYKFDIFGAIHQLFHVAVMIAAVIHFCGLLKAFSTIRSNIDTCITR